MAQLSQVCSGETEGVLNNKGLGWWSVYGCLDVFSCLGAFGYLVCLDVWVVWGR